MKALSLGHWAGSEALGFDHVGLVLQPVCLASVLGGLPS